MTAEEGEARGRVLRAAFDAGVTAVRERYAGDYFAALAFSEGVQAAVDDLRPDLAN